MLKEIFRNYVYPVVTLAGGIVGVGFLSLPYVASKVGLIPMLIYFALVLAVIVFLHTIFAEISLHTPDFKRFPGFAGYYLGPVAKNITLVAMIMGSLGVLLAYIIIGSQFLFSILGPMLGGSVVVYALIYFGIASLLVLLGINIISRVEFFAFLLLAVVFGIIFFKGLPYINLANLFVSNFEFRASEFLLPYGAIMFSLWGTGLIPEAEEMLRQKPYRARHVGDGKKHFKLIVIIGTLLPAIMYLAFMVLVLGVTGSATTESALTGLQQFLGPQITAIALLIGVITTFTAFLSQGLLLKRIFMFDCKMGEFPAWLITCAVPFILFLLGMNSFISIISFIGGVLLSLDGIIILFMYQKIGGRAVVVYPMMLVFVFGMIYTLTASI